MASFTEYLNALKYRNFTYITLVELLDETETITKKIWLDVYESSGSIKTTLQNGVRRTCEVVLDNSTRKYDIDISKIWMFQKLKIHKGIQYINSQGKPDVFLVPQGVYYITNPEEAYNPDTKTITFECVDKWARLNGVVGGNLDGTYSFPKNYVDANGNEVQKEYNMYDIIKNILKIPIRSDYRIIAFIDDIGDYGQINSKLNTFLNDNGFDIYKIKKNEAVVENKTGDIYYRNNTMQPNVAPIWSKYVPVDKDVIDSIEPLLSNYYINSTDVYGEYKILLPYSLTKDLGNTFSDIILEIANILSANVYYDRTGRFVLQPANEESGYLKDVDKEIVWEFVEGDSILYDLPNEVYDFENVYNQVIAQGSISGEGTVTVSVQNDDIKSPTCVSRMGVKAISYTDLPVYSYRLFMEKEGITEDEARQKCEDLLREYAIYLLKKNTILQTKLTIQCMPIPHLDVDQVVTVKKKNGIAKKYLITGIDLPLSATDTMSLELSSIFDIDSITIVK